LNDFNDRTRRRGIWTKRSPARGRRDGSAIDADAIRAARLSREHPNSHATRGVRERCGVSCADAVRCVRPRPAPCERCATRRSA
jgi:hypothetical protein